MSELSDPPRLALDPGAGLLGDCFRNAQEDLPSEQQMARLAERLEPTFASPGPSATPLSGKPLLKLLLGALGLVGVGVLGLSLRGPGSDAAKTDAKPAGKTAISAPAVTATVTAASTPEPPSEARSLTEAPSLAATGTASSASSAPRNNRPSDAARAPSEATLLERARSALASDPARALALTREHQTRYPNGILKQEREVIAIEALRRLGRSKSAAERAGSFEQAFPDSAHRRAVEGGLAK